MQTTISVAALSDLVAAVFSSRGMREGRRA